MNERSRIKSEIETLLSDIIGGMEIPKKGKSLPESFLDELNSRLKSDASHLLKDGNALRELDALLLEVKAQHVLLEKIYSEVDPTIREQFRDRRIDRRKPVKIFLSTFGT
jgi:hypothetical protein